MTNSRTTDGAGCRTGNGGKVAVGYVRVSTERQGAEGISLDAQKDAIERFAEAMGHAHVEIFEDVASGVGEKSFYARDRLRAALDLARRQDTVLIVWDWDRLSRFSQFDKQVRKIFGNTDRIICAKNGAQLRAASEAATFAHDERVANEISRRTKDGMAKKTSEGAVFGNPQISTKVQPKGVASYSSKADDLVRRIADVLRDLDDPHGVTYGAIAQILNEKDIRTLHGSDWNSSRARAPVKKARALLRKEEEDALVSLTTFGMF